MAQQIALNMDCMEYMRTLPDKAFDLAIVDPPYGGGGTSCWTRPRGRFGGRFNRYRQDYADGRDVGDKVPGARGGIFSRDISYWDIAPDKSYFDELFRVSKEQIIWGGNYFDLPPTRCFIVWRKLQIPLEGFSMSPVEYAWASFAANASMFEAYSSGGSGREARFHPTQKPVELYEWQMQKYAKQGWRILDTHLGSGSSRIAAYNLNFDFVGCEIDKAYFDKQEERFARHTAQLSLFAE